MSTGRTYIEQLRAALDRDNPLNAIRRAMESDSGVLIGLDVLEDFSAADVRTDEFDALKDGIRLAWSRRDEICN